MIVLFNKPFNVLSQFTDNTKINVSRGNLSDYIDVPNVYPAGRLDKDSEGLLILTDQGKLQQKINEAIEDLAAKEKYDLILYQGVAFASKEIDITNELIKVLGKTK